MAGCIENLPACVWFEGGDRRNALASILAGLLVSNDLSCNIIFNCFNASVMDSRLVTVKAIIWKQKL